MREREGEVRGKGVAPVWASRKKIEHNTIRGNDKYLRARRILKDLQNVRMGNKKKKKMSFNIGHRQLVKDTFLAPPTGMGEGRN